MSKQLGFYFDSTACVNCRACQIACQDKNNLPQTMRWRRIVQYGGGSWVKADGIYIPNNIYVYSVSMACNHCENPACVQVCPTQAMHKLDNGLVQVDQEQCIGCRYCQWACPYGAPQYDGELGKMTKCTGCSDLIAQGENPACVDACVMRALEFGDIQELRAKHGNLAAVAPLPESALTNPALVISPHKNSQPVAARTAGRILNLPEELA